MKQADPRSRDRKNEQGRATRPRLTPPAVSYIAGIISVGMLAGTLALFGEPMLPFPVLFAWIVFALCGELMMFHTAGDRAQINMGTTMHLAMVLALTPGPLTAALWISRSIAKFVIQRQTWYRAWFNVAQVTLATLGAAATYRLLGGAPGPEMTPAGLLPALPPFLAAAFVYWAINTVSVAQVVALTSRGTLWRTWRENYGYAAEIGATAALVLLAPVAALCHAVMGWAGLTVFLAPMFFIRLTSVRYVALRQAQQQLIASERLAAKGEIAGEVGHELGNYLHGVYANLQLLTRDRGEGQDPRTEKRLETVLQQLDNIAVLSRGLAGFGGTEMRRVPTSLNGIIETTVAFLEPQNRFDRVAIDLDLDRRLADVLVDPAQIQQVVMNLAINAANALREAETKDPQVHVWSRLHDVTGAVEFGVSDNGPGVPRDLRARVFEPGFTTRDEGHGFGLATALAIVRNHTGSLTLEDAPEGGALFRVVLPLGARRAA